jgi:hypothetical protein
VVGSEGPADGEGTGLHFTLGPAIESLGVELVSGFSPAILSSVLGREIKSPYDTMMDVIGNPRYEFE